MHSTYCFLRKRQRLANLLTIWSTAAQGGIWQRTLEHRRVEKEPVSKGREDHRATDGQISSSGGEEAAVGSWCQDAACRGHCHGWQAARRTGPTVHWSVLGSQAASIQKNAVLSLRQSQVWTPGSQPVNHDSIMFMHLTRRGECGSHMAFQHLASQGEFSTRSGMCVPEQEWCIKLFSHREVLLCPADTSHVNVPSPFCPGWRLWGPHDSISDFVESCPIGYSVLPVCGNQFNAVSLTQSSSHLGFPNFMQLAALKIWMHSLKDSTEEKQLIMGNYAFWDR